MDLIINSNLVIPSRELKWRFSRASGPGGQNINKTDSRVELIFEPFTSSVLTEFQKHRLKEHLKKQLVNGYLSIVVQEKRSQYLNRQQALIRLGNFIREGLKPPTKARQTTIPTQASQKRRIDAKRQRAEIKRNRRNRYSQED